jgi:ribosomal protein S6--L-glutamate ligase
MFDTRIAIVGSADSFYARDLQRASTSLGFVSRLNVVSFQDLFVDSYLGSHALCDYDAVLVRSMPLGSLEQVVFRMNALQVIQRRGTLVINQPRTLEIAIDKWLTLDFASQSGLAIPRTHACQTREQAMSAFDSLGRDVVVKPIFGGEGRGLIRVSNVDMAHRVFSTLEQIQSVAYLQEFVPHFGYDIRVLFVGDEYFCIARHAPDNDWRTNISRGGHAVRHQVTDHQLEMARQAKDMVKGDVIGVDILPAKDGRDLLLEVNAVPGWKGVATACEVDIAQKVLELAMDRISCQRRPD